MGTTTRNTIVLGGQAWKALRLHNVRVTGATHIDFFFKSSETCARHGLALINNLDSSTDNLNLQVAGSESTAGAAQWTVANGHQNYLSGWRHYTIPLMQFYGGEEYSYLGFINSGGEDDDAAACTGSSVYGNVVLG